MGTATSRNVVQSVANVTAEASNSAIQTVAVSARSSQAINVAGVSGDVTIRKVRMDGSVELSVQAYLDATQSNEVQQKVAQQMEQMAKASVSGINLGNSSRTSNEVSTAINAVVRTTNMTSQACDTEALSNQVINVADVGGAVLIEDVEMGAAVKALADCRLNLVQGNSSVQDLQQTMKQTAVSETVGLDLAAFLWLIVAGVVALGIVTGVSMLIAYKTSRSAASTLVKLLIPLAILGGAAFAIFVLLSRLDPVQPPPGVAPEDNILQYPFLRREVVAEDCAPAVFENRTQFASPVATPQQLSDWVKAYNAKVDAHEARISAAGVAAPALVTPEEVGEGPEPDAPTDRRWPLIKIASMNQRTGEVSCYAGEPPNHLRGWAQWGPTDAPVSPATAEFGPNVYRENDKFADPTRVALLSRLGEALALLEFLRCAEARAPLTKFALTPDGTAACAAEVEAFHKLLKDSGAWERDGWEAKQTRRFVPDSRFSLQDIQPRALWEMLTGLPPTDAPLAGGTLAAALPDGMDENTMREERFTVEVAGIVPGLDARVLPLLAQLKAVRAAVGAEQGVSEDVLAVWDRGFADWQARMEAGYAAFDAGSPGDPDSWRDVTLAFVSRLDRVRSLSFNPSSPQPVYVDVMIWIGVVGGVGLVLAMGAYAFINRQQAKGSRDEEFEEAKRRAQLRRIEMGNSADGNAGMMARMMGMLMGGGGPGF